MSQPIKYFKTLKGDHVRKRDGEKLTHALYVAMTEDEAMAVSSLFSQRLGTSPKISLIRAFLLAQAQGEVDEEALVKSMAWVRTLASLASDMSSADYSRAVAYLKDLTATKPSTKKPTSPPVRSFTRVYVPEQKRK